MEGPVDIARTGNVKDIRAGPTFDQITMWGIGLWTRMNLGSLFSLSSPPPLTFALSFATTTTRGHYYYFTHYKAKPLAPIDSQFASQICSRPRPPFDG
jgi:hypothetical protein